MRHNSIRLRTICFLFFALWAFQIVPLSAQGIKFSVLTIEEGLSQNTLWTQWRDTKGFLWFGTQDGLNRYDGHTVTIFRHDPQDSTTLSDNHVWSIVEDREGFLWMGTLKGLNRYNPQTNVFEHAANNPKQLAILQEKQSVRSLLVDKTGTLWVGVDGNGLLSYASGTQQAHHYQHEPAKSTTLPSNRIYTLAQDRNGKLWVGTYDAGLASFDNQTQHFTHFKSNGQKGSLSGNRIYSIFQDSKEQLWIGTDGQGLNRFDPQTNSFHTYRHDPKDPSSLSDDRIHSILEDTRGQLWIGTYNGLNRWDASRSKATVFKKNPNVLSTLSDNHIVSLAEDAAGHLLVGTYGGGLTLIDFEAESFQTYSHDPEDPKTLLHNIVWSIYEDSHGRLWVGTDVGLSLFHPETESFEHFTHDPKNPNSIPKHSVTGIYEDKKGRLWIATHGGGLCLFTPQTKRFQVFKHNPADASSLLNDQVGYFYEDPTGRLWVGTNKGISILKPDNTFENLTHDPTRPSSFLQNAVTCIVKDSKGRMWVGSDGGLSRLDESTQQFEHYQHDPENPSSLSTPFVYAIHEARNGLLWIGTANGLHLFDPDTKTFQVLREKEGLPNHVIYGILEDDKGRLWMSTNKGLSRFSPALFPKPGNWGVFRNYVPADGLQNNEYSLGATHKGKDSRMYFGGINGFNVFHPDSVQDNTYTPPVVLTGFSLFNKSIQAGKSYDGFVLPKTIAYEDELVLSHRESVFTLEFAALSYAQPERCTYAYKLENFDTDWNYTDASRRFATYTNLDPGTYRFYVKCANQDGLWNEESTSLLITITPPWWETWWFRIVIALSLVGLVATISVWRTRSIRNRNQKLEKEVEEKTKELSDQREELAAQNEELNNLNAEKNNLIGIVAHDLKSPLNQIKGLINVIRTSASLNEETKGYLQLVENSTNRLTEMVGKILDVEAIDSKQLNISHTNVNLSELMHSVVERFQPEVDKKHLRIYSSIAEGIVVSADSAYTEQILENLVSNAVKFSPAHKNIYVSIVVEQNMAVCEIRDEGPGLTEEDKKKLFGKYQKLSAYPTGNETSTGLGLAIVKKFVEAMGGETWCESEVGKGASFFVSFHRVG